MTLFVRAARFNAVGAAGIVVQLAALWLLTHAAHVNYLWATAIAVTAAVLHNFAWHWWWTWRDRTGGAAVLPALARFAAANGMVSGVTNLGIMATLVPGARLDPVAANAIAIALAGVLNFALGETFVFRELRSSVTALQHGPTACHEDSTDATGPTH